MPSTTTQQPLTEATLLTRYLLPDSSLPSILPYNTFITLLPSSARNDPSLAGHLRRLYADLQFQRNVDLDNVRANIERECARAGTVKARLRKDVMREMGASGSTNEAEVEVVDMDLRKREASLEIAPSKKRKRSPYDEDEDQNEDNEASDDPEDTRSNSRPDKTAAPTASVDEDDEDEEDNERTEIPESPQTTNDASSPPALSEPPHLPTTSTNTNARLDALLDTAFHGPRGIALPSHTHPGGGGGVAYHSKDSLLDAMEAAIASLQGEIAALETEATQTMQAMRETVGDLSDLRYGKLGRDGGGGGGSAGVENEVEEGLRELRRAVERKMGDGG